MAGREKEHPIDEWMNNPVVLKQKLKECQDELGGTLILVMVLLDKLGGTATISDVDLNRFARGFIFESVHDKDNRSFQLTLKEHK